MILLIVSVLIFFILILGIKKSNDFYFIEIDSCQILDKQGIVYYLTENVSSISSCFFIEADNVLLDCKGNRIVYSLSGKEGNYGFFSDSFNSSIRNCVIIDGDESSEEIKRHGIYFNGVSSGLIENNFIEVFSPDSFAIYLEKNSNFNQVINNFAFSNSGSGIFIYFSDNNLLKKNSGFSYLSSGVLLSNSKNNELIFNSGLSYYYPGIHVSGSLKNYLSANNGSSYHGYGFYVSNNSHENNLVNNVGYSVFKKGFFVESGLNYLEENIGFYEYNEELDFFK